MEGIAALGYILSLPLCSSLFSVSKLSCFPNKSFSTRHAKVVRIKATPTLNSNDQESNRKYKKLPPWGHRFHLPQVDVAEMNDLAQEIEKLKPKIKEMLMFSSKSVESTKKRILLIYMLVSLGVAYHFEDEIEESLKESFEKINEMVESEDDLYTISIMFWIFRTYGYNMTSDVFKRFKGENEKFKESLIGDVKGMLSFYEATHLRTTTDDIMEEALSFTTINLESLATSEATSPHMSMRIRNALSMPQHYDAKMAFTRGYISFYGHEKDHNKILLRFAKINFKFMQLHWIQELETMRKWWKQQDLASRLPPYFRDRLLECYLYALLVYFEPRFSRGRLALAKLYQLISIVDDPLVIDMVMFLKLQLFLIASKGVTFDMRLLIEKIYKFVYRWDPDHMENVPNYIKTIFNFVWSTFKECESMGRSEEGLSYNVEGALEEFKIYLRANAAFNKWEYGDMVPTFEEFLEIGAVEISMYVTIGFSLLGLGKTDREQGYKWLKARPKFVNDQGKKGRLMNDLSAFEDDIGRGYVVHSVKYYMKQYKVTEEEAFTRLQEMVRDLDKKVNEGILKTPKTVPREVMKRAIDHGIMVDFTYRTGEEYTQPEGRFKDNIESLFVNLISL